MGDPYKQNKGGKDGALSRLRRIRIVIAYGPVFQLLPGITPGGRNCSALVAIAYLRGDRQSCQFWEKCTMEILCSFVQIWFTLVRERNSRVEFANTPNVLVPGLI